MTHLIVAPVAVKPEQGQLQVHLLRDPDGTLPTAPLRGDRSVLAQAQELLGQLGHKSIPEVCFENVGAIYQDGEPYLVTTTVLPMLVDNSVNSGALVPFASGSDSAKDKDFAEVSDPVQRQVIEYWRRQFIRTNAVLDFLPKYFTSNQVRALYSSLWGKEQSDGNFARWLRDVKGEDGTLIRADLHKDPKKAREQVRTEVRDDFAERVAQSGIVNAEAIIKAWPSEDKAPVGISASVHPLSELITAIHPELSDIGAEVGAEVAYQDVKKGSPPNWHTRGHNRRVLIEPCYSVPPKREYPTPTFI
ncbi:MAG: hypothetical protein LBB58_06865 [Cellulomonadaceae bacterium]|jgi:hypothetical protein|nr:hypothetical protein [Cellulomonadaceae bacterium]